MKSSTACGVSTGTAFSGDNVKVLIAHHSGFCGGVKRAMRIAMEAARQYGELEADGPLVHNRQTVQLLELHGITTDQITPEENRHLLIRAHGVAPEKLARYTREGRRVVDATCVHVAHNQQLAGKQAGMGRQVVFVGDRDHAETMAVTGSAGPDCLIISTAEEAEALASDRPIFLLVQTTFNLALFEKISGIIRKKHPDAVVMDTICRATHDRQEEAARLAGDADALVVVGGRDSANTRRLADAGKSLGKPVFHVETTAELKGGDFAGFRVVAVIAGASTPGWITQDVVNRLRGMGATPLLSQGMRLLQALVESRITLALSAAGLALGAGFFFSRSLLPALTFMGGAYVFFAHTLNRRIPRCPEARRLSLADSFYRTRRPPLLALAWLAAGAALALSLLEGSATAGIYTLLILATVLYALPAYLASSWLSRVRQSLLPRNWPMGAGWTLALGVPAALAYPGGWIALFPICFIFCICLGGTLVRDMHDIVSDRLMGIDTIPARIGIARSHRLAELSLGIACALPLVAAAAVVFGQGEHFSTWLLFSLFSPLIPALGLVLSHLVREQRLLDAVVIQAGVDGMGCLAGLLAVILGAWS